jgi:hypothetical protein
MDSMQNFQARLALLDSMLSKLRTSHARVRQLKRSVQVLRHLLSESGGVRSPYGPETPLVRFSLQ